ncbi:DMT family transporter, partial [Bifidobacterium pseudocatenulatum]|uniref:DMT family transporter n=2 Tax=Bifidobacterium pseudocatenulatum TaxID=28026 RepID=UPI0034A2E5D3
HACLPSQSEPPRPSAQLDPRNRRREYNVAETKGDHMLLAALGVLTRIVTPLQTVVNARLRGTLGTPFRASLVSFTVGLAATTIAALLLGPYPLVPESALHGPWWMWFAGLFGVIFMTGNILLLPRLGSLQTVLMPVLGQITMGLLIDQFGWLGNPRHPMTMARAAGLVLAVLGVLLAVAAADAKTLFGGPNPFGSRHGAARTPRNAVRGHVATPCGRPLHEPNPLAKHLAMAWTGHTLRHVVGGASRHAGTTGYGARIADQGVGRLVHPGICAAVRRGRVP